MVTKLKEAEVRVKRGSILIFTLLFANDAIIFMEDETSMRLGLDVVMEWHRMWSVRVIVARLSHTSKHTTIGKPKITCMEG